MVTIVKKIADVLDTLEVEEGFNKKAFVESHWGYSDYFKERTFDVSFCKAKKQMPKKDFKSIKGVITRIK
jgi:hypothetical protein